MGVPEDLMLRAILSALMLTMLPAMAAPERDVTAIAEDACLNKPENASTAGQTECEAVAAKAYDQRMNRAYASLLRRLPAPAAEKLRVSQRAWIAFRDSEQAARSALFATRSGTLYVPMQAASAVRLVRDRALELESYQRIVAIDD
jgi:uncharacterized protein YecT (DUF1311 family)